MEYSLCQRYYERIGAGATGQASGFVSTPTNIAGTVHFTTTKRTTSYTVDVLDPGGYVAGGTGFDIVSLLFTNGRGLNQVGVDSTSFTGSVVAGQGLLFRGFDIGVDDEL